MCFCETDKQLPSLHLAEVLVSDVSVMFAAKNLAKRIVWIEVWGIKSAFGVLLTWLLTSWILENFIKLIDSITQNLEIGKCRVLLFKKG